MSPAAPVYLDHNATTGLDPRVREAMLPWLDGRPANPSSVHSPGRAARGAVEAAREQIAELVGAHSSEVIFTSGGTESNNLAIKGLLGLRPPARLAVSAIEHPSVLEPARSLRGWGLDLIGVDAQGRVTPDHLEACLDPETRLVSVMWANNETGVVQDLHRLAQQVREGDAILHSDAVQAAGKVELDFATSGVQMMTLTAHKMYGPVGVGALVCDRSLDLAPLVEGGGQEHGLRGGTLSVAGIAGFGAAAELARTELARRRRHLIQMRTALETGLAGLPGVEVIADQAPRLPNTTLARLPGIQGETLLMNLDRAGIAVSSGSACSSGQTEPSHVLLAMGLAPDRALGVIRISLGKDNTLQDIQRLVAELGKQTTMLRERLGPLAV